MRTLLLVAAGLLVAADEKADGKKDLEKLKGKWEYVSFESNGIKLPADQIKQMSITYTGDRWTVREGDKVVVSGTQKLNPARTPHEVDSLTTEGEGKGTTMLGIYEFKGDTMRVCFDPRGKERPTSFTPKEGQFGGIIKRAKQ